MQPKKLIISHIAARIILCCALPCIALATQAQPIENPVEAIDMSAKFESDIRAVTIYRNGLHTSLDFISSQPDIFSEQLSEAPRLLNHAQKDAVRGMWRRTVEYFMALDSLRQSKKIPQENKQDKDDAFRIRYAAFLAGYSSALQLTEVLERDPAFHIILNEPVPELGLTKDSYSQFKFRFLNVERATQFAALAAINRNAKAGTTSALTPLIAADEQTIWKVGRGKGAALTLQNAARILQSLQFNAWFPVQAGVSEWMGDAKLLRHQTSLISQDQIRNVRLRAQPGDILLERREWYLSNIGLPGFWPHAALVIGTPEERQALSSDVDVVQWVKQQGAADGDFEGLLKKRYPEAYQAALADIAGHPPRVLEAVSEGVIFNSFEHTAHADSLALMRPRLNMVEKAAAILHAFRYFGRPYDFNFDFQTDNALVCTELVYKAYEPSLSHKGVRFALEKIMGRLATPANRIVRQFDEEFGTAKQQMDLVAFFDGNEKAGRADELDVSAFRQSWQRPKWHIFTQGP